MRKAITDSALVLLPAKSRVLEFPNSNEANQWERDVESRIQDLSALVADLTESGFGVLLSEEITTREAFEELRVKEVALRWIARVAKHSNGPVREKLWSDIEIAVAGLEKTAELLLHSGISWPRSTPSILRDSLAGPGQF